MPGSKIREGFALFLDPRLLAALGASCNQHEEERIQGLHFFLCIDMDPALERFLWVPITSKQKHGRIVIAAADKTGSPQWRRISSYCISDQIWTTNEKTAIAASTCPVPIGHDRVRQNAIDSIVQAVVDATEPLPYP